MASKKSLTPPNEGGSANPRKRPSTQPGENKTDSSDGTSTGPGISQRRSLKDGFDDDPHAPKPGSIWGKRFERLRQQNRQLLEELKKLKMGRAVPIHSEEALETIIREDPEIDADAFGVDNYKTVANLYKELSAGLCTLERDTRGIRRVLEVVFVRLRYNDVVLVETHEQMNDGRVRSRNFLPGVKKLLGESSQEAVERWMEKELGLNPDCLQAKGDYKYQEYEKESSLSYPIRCFFRRHEMNYEMVAEMVDPAALARLGLPGGNPFTTTDGAKIAAGASDALPDEAQPGSTDGKEGKPGQERRASLKNGVPPGEDYKTSSVHFWAWYKTAVLEAVISDQKKGSDKEMDLTKIMENLFGTHKFRNAYQTLLLQMFGQKFDAIKLCGGFSGSLVLRVQPYDFDGNLEEPVIVKLDQGAPVRTEVVRSEEVYAVLADRAAKVLGEPVYVFDEEKQVELGAFKLELAGACWSVPEFANCSTSLLSTFKDLFIYETIQQMLPKNFGVEELPPLGNVQLVIAELLGPGGMLRAMRARGAVRATEHIFTMYNLKGKDTKFNWFFNPEYPGKNNVEKMYKSLMGEDMPDARTITRKLNQDMKDLPRMKDMGGARGEPGGTVSPFEAFRPLICLGHGDLNAANVMIDAMDAVWMIDFATSKSLPLGTDLAKMEVSKLFEYTIIPVTPDMLLWLSGGPDGTEEDWSRMNVHDWMGVKPEVIVLLMKDLKQRHQNMTESGEISSQFEGIEKVDLVKTDKDLEKVIMLTCGAANLEEKKRRHCMRELRARLTVNPEVVRAAFAMAKKAADHLIQKEFLWETLEESSKKRGPSNEELFPSSQGTTSLVFTLHQIQRLRRYFLDDWMDTTRKHCSFEKEVQEKKMRTVDAMSIQLYLPLLRESYRLFGYRDITPWTKMLAIPFVMRLNAEIRSILDDVQNLATKTSIKTRLLTEMSNNNAKRWDEADSNHNQENIDAALNLTAAQIIQSYEVYNKAQDYAKAASLENAENMKNVKNVRKLHTQVILSLEQEHFFRETRGVFAEVKDLQVRNKVDLKNRFELEWKIHKAFQEVSPSDWMGTVRVQASKHVVGHAKVSKLQEKVPTLELLVDQLTLAELTSAGNHLSQLSKGSSELSLRVPLELEWTAQIDTGFLDKYEFDISVICSDPVCCYAPGDRLRINQNPPGMNSAMLEEMGGLQWWDVTVNEVTQNGTYFVRYDQGSEQMLLKFDPCIGNHQISTSYRYRPDTELMVYTPERDLWVDVKVVETPEHGNHHVLQYLDTQDPEAEDAPLKKKNDGLQEELLRFDLNTFNHCFAGGMHVKQFDEEAHRFRGFMKSRYGYTIDSISGQKLDVLKDCATFLLLPKKDKNVAATIPAQGTGESQNMMGTLERMIQSRDARELGRSSSHAFVVVGPPGCGKSCLIRRLIVYMLNSQTDMLPIIIPVTDFASRVGVTETQAEDEDQAEGGRSADEDLVDKYLRVVYGEESLRYKMIKHAIACHRVVFLFDNDAGGPLPPPVEKCLVLLAAQLHRLVYTGRPDSVSESKFPKLQTLFNIVELQQLDLPRQRFIVGARLGQIDAKPFLQFLERFEEGVAEADTGTDDGKEEAGFLRSPTMLSMLLCYWQMKKQKRAEVEKQQASASSPRKKKPQEAASGKREDGPTKKNDDNMVTITEVFRVAIDHQLLRVQSKQQADRHKVKDKIKLFHQLLQQIAYMLQSQHRRNFVEAETVAWLADNEPLLEVWIELQRAIHAGQIALMTASKEDGEIRYQFAFYAFQKFLCAYCLVEEEAYAQALPALYELMQDRWWSDVMEMLCEKWPPRYQKIMMSRIEAWHSDTGDSALHVAAQLKHMPLFDALADMPQDFRQCINLQNKDSNTALHIAAKNGSPSIVKALLDCKADVWLANQDGWIPLYFAAAAHNKDIIRNLVDNCHSQQFKFNPLLKLQNAGLDFATRVLDGRLTEQEFMERVNLTFPELNYFKGRSDTTPDASASVAMTPAEIEYRRTLGAMLSVYWICSDNYDLFVRSQKPNVAITKESWATLRDWTVKVVGMNTPETLDAMFCYMTIHDMGKLKDMREDLAPGIHDHDVALGYIVDNYPEVLPSFARLDEQHKTLVQASVKVQFNFGQFLQAENIPGSLVSMKDLLGEQGEKALAFYLFHIFADMSGILGAKSLEGSLFMSQHMYSNFKKGLDVLQLLATSTAQETYDQFLQKRSEGAGLNFEKTPEHRALARLACCTRVFDAKEGAKVEKAFYNLDPQDRAQLTRFLNANGIDERPGFLLYYAPAFMDNANHNDKVGLENSMRFMLRVYQASEEEYSFSMQNVVTIHIGELANWNKACTSEDVYVNTYFQVRRSPGARGASESTIMLSPWRYYRQVQELQDLRFRAGALVDMILGGSLKEKIFINQIQEVYPELKYFGSFGDDDEKLDADTEADRAEYKRTLGAMLSIFWVCSDRHGEFVREQSTEARLRPDAWQELQEWAVSKVDIKNPEVLDSILSYAVIHLLAKIRAFRKDLTPPGTHDHKAALEYILEHHAAILPSFHRLNDVQQSLIRDCVKVSFSFAQFLQGENLPASLISMKELLGQQGDSALGFFLFHIFAHMAGSEGDKSLDGSRWMTDPIFTSFKRGLDALHTLTSKAPQDAYNSFLSRRAQAMKLGFDDGPERKALVRIACLAGIFDEKGAAEIQPAFDELSMDERWRLTKYLNDDGIRNKPAFLLRGAPALVQHSRENESVGLERCMRQLLKIYEAAAFEYASNQKERGQNASKDVVLIHVGELASFAKNYSSSVAFDHIRLDVTRNSANEAVVLARPWVPVREEKVIETLSRRGHEFAAKILEGRLTEAEFLDQSKHIFPELNYFRGSTETTPDASASVQQLSPAEIEYRRTIGSMLAVYWVGGDKYNLFVQGQAVDRKLSKQSWEGVREWAQMNVGLVTPDALDAMLCYMAIHDLGKMTHFRDDLAPGIQDHDMVLDKVLETNPEVLPSYSRLPEEYQKLIRASVRVQFNFGQFLQAENLPANLKNLQTLTDQGEEAIGFYLFHIFADMCGILGAKSLEGSLFMTETMYANFNRGRDVLQMLSSTSVWDTYDVFLQRRSALCFSRFSSDAERAVVRLACCARVFDYEGGTLVQNAFQGLYSDERARLTKYLNADGIRERPGFLLYYAPAFMENAKLNPHAGLENGMRVMLAVYDKAAEEYKESMCPVVTVHIGSLAQWSKKCADAEHFKNTEFTITRSTGDRGAFECVCDFDSVGTDRNLANKGKGKNPRARVRPSSFDIHDIDLHDRPANTGAYFEAQKDLTGLHATTSCYSLWSANGQVNGSAKVVPALRDKKYHVFFFDDNIEFDSGGGRNDKGIVNLRTLHGDFIDFTEGKNGFMREQCAENSEIFFSTQYNCVLVRVNILDAMCDDQYFTKIVERFSRPGEKNILYMDINATIIFGDIMSGRDKDSVLLNTMFECMMIKPYGNWTFNWGKSKCNMDNKQVPLKKMLKKALDKETYKTFWTYGNCFKVLQEVMQYGQVNCSGRSIDFEDFNRLYRMYSDMMTRTVKKGVVRSWFELYRQFKNDHLLMLNTFGVESRRLILETVEDEEDVTFITVNYYRWDDNDRAKFEEQYMLPTQTQDQIKELEEKEKKELGEKSTTTQSTGTGPASSRTGGTGKRSASILSSSSGSTSNLGAPSGTTANDGNSHSFNPNSRSGGTESEAPMQPVSEKIGVSSVGSEEPKQSVPEKPRVSSLGDQIHVQRQSLPDGPSHKLGPTTRPSSAELLAIPAAEGGIRRSMVTVSQLDANPSVSGRFTPTGQAPSNGPPVANQKIQRGQSAQFDGQAGNLTLPMSEQQMTSSYSPTHQSFSGRPPPQNAWGPPDGAFPNSPVPSAAQRPPRSAWNEERCRLREQLASARRQASELTHEVQQLKYDLGGVGNSVRNLETDFYRQVAMRQQPSPRRF